MVPLSKGLPQNRKRTRRSRHRPVRHSPEPPDPGLHQPLSRPECPSPGCSQHRLEHSPSGFPPMPILPKVLQKIRQSSVDVTLVAPAWPTQSWFQTSSRRQCNARLGRTATPECTTTMLGCCPGFPQSERLFSGDCQQNRSPTAFFYQIRL